MRQGLLPAIRRTWPVAVLLACLGGCGWRDHGHKPGPRLSNVRNLADLTIARAARRGWPPYSGRAFVLSLVAYGELDRRNKMNLETLWSDPRSLTPAVVAAYAQVTRASLDAGMDVRDLTSYVGRRNADPAYRLAPGRPAVPQALLADLDFPDGAIVAFTDHGVRFLSRKELGLGPDDPIVAGESSRSPILRQLSE